MTVYPAAGKYKSFQKFGFKHPSGVTASQEWP